MMLRILVLFLLIGQLSFGQTNTPVVVPGTKCSIVPPEGFEPATSFSGFQNAETGASIMINELPAPYETLAAGFTAEALRTKGMTLTSKEVISFNSSEATMLNVTQLMNGTTYIKQLLIFGDKEGAVLVNGIYPEASKELEGKIKDALLSTVYNSSRKDNPLNAAPFTVNTEGSEFKPVKYLAGALLYSADGLIPTEKPTLIIGVSLSKVFPEHQKQYAVERLEKLAGGEFNSIKESMEVTIDNMNGYEIIANRKDDEDRSELIYQVMLFDTTGDYYIIVGQAKDDFDRNLETYKKIARTFKRK